MNARMYAVLTGQTASGPPSREIILLVLLVLFVFVFWLVVHLRNRANKKKARQLARTDLLTGLPNGDELRARMEKVDSGALAVFEIKFFKAYNELMGYEVGDRVLKTVAAQLMAAQQQFGVFAARLQSASFAVLLPQMNKEGLQEMLYSLLEQVGRQEGASNWSIRFACGAAYIQPEIAISETLENANFARHAAKDSLETEVVVFDGETYQQFSHYITEAGLINKGAGTGDLVIAYQPKYALSNGRLVGAEALIRWQHPQRGLLLPAEFLPVLEQTGSIKRVDLFVLRQVFWQLSDWKARGLPDVPIAVNLSRMQFTTPNVAQKLVEIAAEYGVPPYMVQLELTEDAVLEDGQQVAEALQQLKEAGFGIAMDDFGKGVSSLNHLRDLPVDVVNMDRGLLAGVETDTRKQMFVRDVVRLAHDMGITTLLKGVETPVQAGFAQYVMCDLVQGFWFSKPMPAEQYGALLMRSRQNHA